MKKVYLIILDGFGLGKKEKGNAIYQAEKPFLDSFLSQDQVGALKTDGESVGLPSFQTGGSEAGHITLGAGRPIKHLLTRINDQIDSGAFFENDVLKNLFAKASQKGKIHFMGLCSDGGIHSFLPHLFGLQKMAQKYGIKEIYIHAQLDGRDVGERTALDYLKQIVAQDCGDIASLSGRFFGMDRDNNWDRVEPAYQVMTNSSGNFFEEGYESYLKDYYKNSEKSDYYVPPVLLNKKGVIGSADVVINFDYRTDRMRQISQVFCAPDFNEFKRDTVLDLGNYGIFGPYCSGAQEVFNLGSEKITGTLGEVLSGNKMSQLRISETEKFNHVTFFFSGERKQEFEGEDRILIPSPKCASYAEAPAMSAVVQTEAVMDRLTEKDYNFVVQNYANSDLVGHSGNLAAATKSIEVLDACLKQLIPFLQKKGYSIIVTADHGNSDEMILPNGEVNAGHTKNLVPCVVFDTNGDLMSLQKNKGTLADIAPTVCALLGLKKGSLMEGESLI